MNILLNNYNDEDQFTRGTNFKIKIRTIWKVIFSKHYLFFDVNFTGKHDNIIHVERYRLKHNGVGKTLKMIGKFFLDQEQWGKRVTRFINNINKN